jgi:RNA-directed DNA polymerase
MEQRGTRTQYRKHSIQDSPSGEQIGFFGMNSEKWLRYVRRAADKRAVFTTPFNLFDEHTLLDGFKLLDGSKAVGIDGISKREFKVDLEKNLKTLARDLTNGKYRPAARKEVLIPKANGKMRPIAIACFKDKVVEAVATKILTFIYEPLFIKNSYGFRPRKSAHGAIEASYMILKDEKRPWIVEIDFTSFFNTVPHKALLSIIKKRVNDKRMLALIRKFMKSKIVSLARASHPTVGTPQGSVISPVLSNIYLHEVLDEWFTKNHASQNAQMVRYADDAIFMFATKEQAEKFLTELKDRIEKYGLSLNQEKTRLIDFRKENAQTFSFLGFTFYWGKPRGKRSSSLRVKTQKEKLFKKSDEIKAWIKDNRSKLKASSILNVVASKLRGHYNYFGFKTNRSKLVHFHWLINQHLYKWLNRRSQKKSYNWKQFNDLTRRRLPRPPEMYLLKPLGVNYARSY